MKRGTKANNVKKRNFIILFLCLFLIVIAVAYANSNSFLNVNGVSKVTSTWDVRIVNVETTNIFGGGITMSQLFLLRKRHSMLC